MKLQGQRLDGIPYGRCYLISNINAMSLITWKELTPDLYRKLINDMLKEGHNPKYGKFFTSWPRRTIPRWKENMGDDFKVNEIKVWSARYYTNMFRKRPMVISINVWSQFETDREDGVLTDELLDDKTTNWHATVQKWYRIYDSREDQKTYSFTHEYLRNVKWFFKSTTVLEFIKL